MNWQIKSLDEVCIKITDGAHQSPKTVDSGKPMASVKDLTRFGVDLREARKISVEDFERLVKQGCQPQVGDVLIAKDGNSALDTVCNIKQPLEAVLLSSVAILRPNFSVLDSDFLKFYLSSKDVVDYFKSNFISGAAIPRVVLRDFRKAQIYLPELKTQKQIAKILSDLDDKIHLNNQINQTLESIAQAIFKSWFIDFEPVHAKIAAKQAGQDPELAAMYAISGKSEAELEQMAEDDFAELQATAALFPDELVESEFGEVPRGWEVSTVGEQIQTVGGGTPSTKNADFWDDGIHYWTTPKDLSNLTDKILLNTERKITDAGLKKISSGLLPKDTVLMSSRAPVGYLALSKIEVAINQGYIAILPNMKYSAEYLIQWCEANMAEIKGRASGTTFQEISKKNFREISFVCPDDKVVVSYTKTVKTLYDEITSKAKENQSLVNLRDTLLPKLMSGEISLNKNMGSIDD